ncbi:MAG: hypothetical protein V4563_15940 [Pseudomonadota bacterium]
MSTTTNDRDIANADLILKARDLVNLIEGIQSVRWHYEGRRLKDTPQWAAFYVAVNKAMPTRSTCENP